MHDPAPPTADGVRLLTLFIDALIHTVWQTRPGGDATTDLSRNELRVLRVLEHQGDVPMGTLAEQLKLPLSTTTVTLDRLAARGLALRKRGEADRRQVLAAITPMGLESRSSELGTLDAISHSILAPLSVEERHTLKQMLTNVSTELGLSEEVMARMLGGPAAQAHAAP